MSDKCCETCKFYVYDGSTGQSECNCPDDNAEWLKQKEPDIWTVDYDYCSAYVEAQYESVDSSNNISIKEGNTMTDKDNKVALSAHQLGVLLGIPAYVDPEKGFYAEKVITWENGDKILVKANYSNGAFYYSAVLGQIDPKTNEMSFISGDIANVNSLEELILSVDQYISNLAQDRETPDPAPEIVSDYQTLSDQYQELLLDPDHDHDQVRELSASLSALEMKLREQGIHPSDLR